MAKPASFLNSLVLVFLKPEEFFENISEHRVFFVVPIVILIITGVLLSYVTISEIPAKEKKWDQSGIIYNKSVSKKIEKIKAYMFPLWALFIWVAYTLSLTYMTSAMGGLGDLRDSFKCTSILIYPFATVQILRILAIYVPILIYVYWTVLLVFTFWAFITSIKIPLFKGKLDLGNSIIAAAVPDFAFLLLWIAYGPLINMLIFGYGR